MENGKDVCFCLLILANYSLASASTTSLEVFSSVSLVLADAAIYFSTMFEMTVQSLLHENFFGFPYSTIYWFSPPYVWHFILFILVFLSSKYCNHSWILSLLYSSIPHWWIVQQATTEFFSLYPFFQTCPSLTDFLLCSQSDQDRNQIMLCPSRKPIMNFPIHSQHNLNSRL